MEKVSRIIPSNARIEAVDLSKSKPGRGKLPGVEKESARQSERLPGSDLSAVDRLAISGEFKVPKADEERKANIAQRITDKFFKTYNSKAEVVTDQHNPVLNSSTNSENLNLNNESENAEIEEPVTPVKNDLIPEKEKSINNEQVILSKYA